MSTFYLIAVLVLLAYIAAGLVRIVRGPTPADRLLAAQLFGTTGTVVLALLAEAQAMEPLLDVALVFAALTALTSVAFAQRLWPAERKERP